jgi:hypothetical protein
MEARHERRLAGEAVPPTPTHRITYNPTFVIELEIPEHEDADEVISQMINEWNEALEDIDVWAGAGWCQPENRFYDHDDMNVSNTGSTASWERL